MTAKNILLIVEMYRKKLAELSPLEKGLVQNCLKQLEDVEKLATQGATGSATHVLGFIQGILYSTHVYTHKDILGHNATA